MTFYDSLENPPFKGPAGATIRGPNRTRRYGPDGFPQTDRDYNPPLGPGKRSIEYAVASLHDCTLLSIGFTNERPSPLSGKPTLWFLNERGDGWTGLKIEIPGFTMVFSAGVCLPSVVCRGYLLEPYSREAALSLTPVSSLKSLVASMDVYPDLKWAVILEGEGTIAIAGEGEWDEKLIDVFDAPFS